MSSPSRHGSQVTPEQFRRGLLACSSALRDSCSSPLTFVNAARRITEEERTYQLTDSTAASILWASPKILHCVQFTSMAICLQSQRNLNRINFEQRGIRAMPNSQVRSCCSLGRERSGPYRWGAGDYSPASRFCSRSVLEMYGPREKASARRRERISATARRSLQAQ